MARSTARSRRRRRTATSITWASVSTTSAPTARATSSGMRRTRPRVEIAGGASGNPSVPSPAIASRRSVAPGAASSAIRMPASLNVASGSSTCIPPSVTKALPPTMSVPATGGMTAIPVTRRELVPMGASAVSRSPIPRRSSRAATGPRAISSSPIGSRPSTTTGRRWPTTGWAPTSGSDVVPIRSEVKPSSVRSATSSLAASAVDQRRVDLVAALAEAHVVVDAVARRVRDEPAEVRAEGQRPEQHHRHDRGADQGQASGAGVAAEGEVERGRQAGIAHRRSEAAAAPSAPPLPVDPIVEGGGGRHPRR